ncbi:hypothetical protein Hanom_Chr03g00278171 [Helianthus anomalus]
MSTSQNHFHFLIKHHISEVIKEKHKYKFVNFLGSQNLIIKSKLQVLFFIFTSNFKRCPLGKKFTGGVLYVSKSCKFCPLNQTRLDFLVKSDHPRVILSFYLYI